MTKQQILEQAKKVREYLIQRRGSTDLIDAGSAERSAGAMETVEKRLAEMRENFATKYGVKMEICQQ